MAGLAARMALGAVGLSFAILCSGCALWGGSDIADSVRLSAPGDVIAPTSASDAVPPVPIARLAPLPALSNEPEDFGRLDGSRPRVNGATPIAMRRTDEPGSTAYRSTLVLRRSGIRVAIAGASASVIVRDGDTLGLIALRTYGDRSRAAEIARLNNIENPDLIFPGQVLSLAQAERRCPRTHYQAASFLVEDAAGPEQSRPLSRRAFSPPSARQPDLQRVRATSADPALR